MREVIEKICTKYAKEENFSGVSLLKRKDEVIFEKAYGYANRSFQIPNEINTRFDTASITKVFTAAAILQLVQQKKLSLNDKITEIIDLSDTKIPRDVTIEQLLNHTSGIADDAEEEAGEEYSALFKESPNYAIRECKDFLPNFAYKEPNFKAGTDVRYCNCSFVLLGLVLEKLTEIGYREYVETNIFEKAGMKDSGFFAMDGIHENVAEGYKSIRDSHNQIIGYQKNIYSYPPIGTPDGGAYTTAEDMNRFLTAINKGLILNKKHAKILMQPHCQFTRQKEWYEIPDLYEQNGYAFEFFMLKNEKEPFCIYKDGCNDGVSALFAYYPREKMSLVLLSNQECDVWAMRKEIQLKIYEKYYLL